MINMEEKQMELTIVPETNSNYTELSREIEVGHSIFNNL